MMIMGDKKDEFEDLLDKEFQELENLLGKTLYLC
jgi:hypothetical protein